LANDEDHSNGGLNNNPPYPRIVEFFITEKRNGYTTQNGNSGNRNGNGADFFASPVYLHNKEKRAEKQIKHHTKP
jgi:hypothetical protein